MKAADHDLFDLATKDAILREGSRVWLVMLVIVAPIEAGLMGVLHHEYPLFAYMTGACSRADFVYECARGRFDVLAAVLGLIVFGGFGVVLYRLRRMPPTITCESCGGMGWVLDLEPRGGRCPRCGHALFTYRTTSVIGNPNGPILTRIEDHHQAGSDLIQRFHATRKSWMHRYY